MEKEGLFNSTELEMRFPSCTEFNRQHHLLSDATLCFVDKVGYYKASLNSIPRDSLLALQQAVGEVIDGGTHSYAPPTLVMSGDE